MNPFSQLTDEKLMELYLNGESQAFDVLYGRYKSRVLAYVSKRVPNHSDRGELFQNIFLKFHKSRQLYNPKYSVLQWLFTISRSETLDFIKKKRIQTIPLDFEPELPQEKSLELDIEGIKGLNDKEKQTINMRYLEDKSFQEISQLLKTSEVNARKILSRAMAKIRASYFGKVSK